ncbi:MAG: hypothetical protein M3444_02090 [Acidobacteriota bacterium]|nr:hypothetical protein [Acidobacteriota bacterium]MDQ5836392.1 hypothetical protein [Acidobacteriota bacterium]
MKHRSVIAFILLAAAFVAAPQVSQDLAALKSALGARIRGEILHAFLNLHANEGAGESETRRTAQTMLASCKAEAKTEGQTTVRARRSEDRTQGANEERAQVQPRAEAAPQTDAHKQLAMLVVPSPEAEESSAELPGVDDQLIRGKASELPRRAGSTSELESASELAMLIPPGLGFDLHPGFDATRDSDFKASGVAQPVRAAREQRRSSGPSRRASSQTVRYEAAAASHSEAASKLQSEEMLKNLGPLLRDAVWTQAAEEGMKVRVFKSRRRAGGANPSGAARPAPPVTIQTSAGE